MNDSSVLSISDTVGHVFATDKIAVSGVASGADEIIVTIGMNMEYTSTRHPDQVRLSSDGTFIFASAESFPVGDHEYEVIAIAGGEQSSAVKGEVTVIRSSKDNLLNNPGFEKRSGNGAEGWEAYEDDWGGVAKLEEEAARTGQYGVNITTMEPNNPWVRYVYDGVEEGATYEYTVWVKAKDVTSGIPGFKVEFFSSEVASLESWIRTALAHRLNRSSLTGEWQQIVYRVKAPATAKSTALFVRFYGTGTVFFDDASITKVRDAVPVIQLESDCLFYRPEQAAGMIHISTAPKDGIRHDKVVDIWIYTRETGEVIQEERGIPASETVQIHFDLSQMSMRVPYQVLAMFRAKSGQVLDRTLLELHRWERPTALTEDGKILVDHKPFFPTVMYHVPIEHYPEMAEIGINTVQGNWSRNLEQVKVQLDAAKAHHLKVLVPLYADGLVAGNFHFTREVVTAFKDHPSVLGWYVIDEPNERGVEFSELVDAYKLIRSIDDRHPVYIVEDHAIYFNQTSKVTDIMAVDTYPLPIRPISVVGEKLEKAVQDVTTGTMVWQLVQAFKIEGSKRWVYLPNIDEIRNMVYQSVVMGADAIGFYSFKDPGHLLSTSEIWKGMKQFAQEYPLIEQLIVNFKKINTGHSGDIQWGMWQNEEEQYVVAVHTGAMIQELELKLPYPGYFSEIISGERKLNDIPSHGLNDSLVLKLEPGQAIVMKLTPMAGKFPRYS